MTGIAHNPTAEGDIVTLDPERSLVYAETNDVTGGVEILGPNGLPMCPSDAIDVRASGCRVDGQALYNVTATNSLTSTIADVSAAGLFRSSDVGKVCVVIPAVATMPVARFGAITAVIDANTVSVSLNNTPGALAGATFVWGTDDTAALQSALNAAKVANRAVKLPDGIACVTAPVTQPDGVSVYGVANTKHGGPARNFRHVGSSIVLCKYTALHCWNAGDGSSASIVGTKLQDFNIDGMALCGNVISSLYRNNNLIQVTAIRGTGRAYDGGPGGEALLCTFVSQQSLENVVQVSGDSRFTYNKVMGAGNGFYGVKVSNPNDTKIVGNHIWKDADTSSALGGAVWISMNSGELKSGACQIIANTFDTSFGPHFKLSISGGSKGRSLIVTDNMAFQNPAVPANTYPWADFTGVSSGTLYGLTMRGNTGRGAWDDTAFNNGTTKGSYTFFIDAQGMTGTIEGSNVGGNSICDCIGGAYRNFTPFMDGGNVTVTPAGVSTKTTVG